MSDNPKPVCRKCGRKLNDAEKDWGRCRRCQSPPPAEPVKQFVRRGKRV